MGVCLDFGGAGRGGIDFEPPLLAGPCAPEAKGSDDPKGSFCAPKGSSKVWKVEELAEANGSEPNGSPPPEKT